MATKKQLEDELTLIHSRIDALINDTVDTIERAKKQLEQEPKFELQTFYKDKIADNKNFYRRLQFIKTGDFIDYPNK